MQNFTTIPFKAESEHGLTHANGVAKFSSAGVVLEFESKLFGLIGSGVKEVRLPVGEILDVNFRKGLFKRGAKIVIRMKSFAKLAEVPNQDGKLTLKLVREDFDRGQAAVEQLQKNLIQHAASLPPPHTPIGELLTEENDDETKQLS